MGLSLHDIGHLISNTFSMTPLSFKISPSGLAHSQGLFISTIKPHFTTSLLYICLNASKAIGSFFKP